MANLNKVMLIGRLTRDPEIRTFSNGGKVAAFGFAVNNRKKNSQTGQWEDEAVFLDIEAFNRGEGGRQLADLVEQHMRKGQQFYIEGHLRLDQWQDKTDGSKRSRLKIVMDNFQFLEPRQDGMNNEGGGVSSRPARTSAPPAAPARRPAPASPASNGNYDEPAPDFVEEPPSGGDDNIPF
jgi:single-strand DNA-binding protein